MTLFRKHYREAMNDIKPDAAFVESVIAASKKHRPPLRVRYTRYAAAIAAAVVVVSGTVLSMPLWNKVEQNNDGVISETTVTETAAPDNGTAPLPTASAGGSQSETTPAPEGGNNSSKSQTTIKPSQNNTPKTAFGSISQDKSDKTETESESGKTESQQAEETIAAEQIPQQAENNPLSDDAAESADNGEVTIMRSIVMGDAYTETRENKMPADMAPFEDKAEVYSAKSAAQPEINDTDIPSPTGYRCTNATPRGYTFVNDSGAVITVTINYGGEERAPYIEEDGDNIYAVFTSFGLSVTINASGAERESVEEIINSLR